MKTNIFKFINKKQPNTLTILLVIASIMALVVLISLDIKINRYFVYFLASLLSFIYTMMLIKKASKSLEEIIIQELKVQICFFNKMKDPVNIDWNELETMVENDRIEFKHSDSGKLIGIAYRNSIEEPNKWDDLVELLK